MEAPGPSNADALFDLGRDALSRRDYAEAKPLLRQAADLGHSTAMILLGNLVLDSDVGEVVYWNLRAASAGNVDAMVNLGAIYEQHGESAESLKWYTQAAAAGDKQALAVLATIDRKARIEESRVADLRAAAEGGDPESMYQYALHMAHQSSSLQEMMKTAFPWHARAADAGHVRAMTVVASAAVMRQDTKTAIHWYARAAEAGDEEAKERLAALTSKRQGFRSWFS